MMISIEEEVKQIVKLLSHPAGFNINIAGLIYIRPIDENSPPIRWEVSLDKDIYEYEHPTPFYKEFNSLQEAAQFFVELRYRFEIGLDFEEIV